MIFTSFLFFSSLVVLSFLIAGAPLNLPLDWPSLIFVLVSTLLFVLSCGRFSLFLRGMLSIFRYAPEPPHEDNEEIAQFFQTLCQFEIALFAFNAIWGGVICGGNSDDPDQLGFGLATIFLSLFYTFGIACFIFLPISLRFRESNSPAGASKNLVDDLTK